MYAARILTGINLYLDVAPLDTVIDISTPRSLVCVLISGEDGPSQMALEDIAIFRAIPTCTVFYPSDPVSCERAIELAAKTKGITFTRTSRPTTDLLYANDEVFEVGKAKV